jgi:hypothetical protein
MVSGRHSFPLPLLFVFTLSCGKNESTVSQFEFSNVSFNLEAGSDAMGLTASGGGSSIASFGLLEGDSVSVKTSVSGCTSGFKKAVGDYKPVAGLSFKLYKNDKGCAIKVHSVKLQGLGAAKGVEYAVATGSPESSFATASLTPASTPKVYVDATNPKQRLYIRDIKFDSANPTKINFLFQSIGADTEVKSVVGVANSQSLGSAVLESPNFEIPFDPKLPESLNSGIRFSSYGTVYSGGAAGSALANGGFLLDLKMRCAGNVSLGSVGPVGAATSCPTSAGDAMTVADLQAAVVMCRKDDVPISIDEAEALFSSVPASRVAAAPTGLISVIKNGASLKATSAADLITGLQFKGVKTHFPAAAVDGSSVSTGCKMDFKAPNKGWLILRKTAKTGDAKVSSMLVTNIELSFTMASIGPADNVSAANYIDGDHGVILFRSVANTKGTSAPDAENTRKFFTIPFSERFKNKGDCANGNCYMPNLYLSYPGKKLKITDTVTDANGKESVMFVATIGGINKETMAVLDPVFVSGNQAIYSNQLAMGWASKDYDSDSWSDNCANYYSGITQHYGACWVYNLGSDADGALDDADWGPHVHRPNLPSGAVGMADDASAYVRVKGITRYVKVLDEQTPSFLSEDAPMWIPQSSEYGTVAYRSVANTSGSAASDAQNPRKFFRIPYSERLNDKGDCAAGNCYKPSAYDLAPGKKLIVTDTVMGGDGVERVIFTAKIGGIDKFNMKILDPEFTSGIRAVYDAQLAAGWASFDADHDTWSNNCAQYYGEITQHYSACWVYNIGTDADAGAVNSMVSLDQESNWGPHVHTSGLPSGSKADRNDNSSYVRVRMITRYVKATSDASPSFFTELSSTQIPSNADHGEVLYRSVANTNRSAAADANNPLKFFSIPFAARLTDKGDCKNGSMCYRPSLYNSNLGKKLLVTDTIVGSDGVERVIFKAKIGGIDPNTMKVRGAEYIEGIRSVFDNQLAAGWASKDYDSDTWSNNCAVYYSGITQHYGACWVYNLGSDADSDLLDESWGPHIHRDHAPAGFLPERADASPYARARAITRYVKKLDEVAQTFYTEKAKEMIPTNAGYGSILYRSVGNTYGASVAEKDDPVKFFTIAYADRLKDKGDCADATLCYRPSLYDAPYNKKLQITDTVVGSDGVERVMFVARIAGIDKTTMKVISPEFVEGNQSIYLNQLAYGWASKDYDADTWSNNCATYYSGITQHYGACWVYNLGSDADSDLLDQRWGPHVHAANLPSGSLAEDGDSSGYVKVRAITRYVKQIDDLTLGSATVFVDAEQATPVERISNASVSMSGEASRDASTFAAGAASLSFKNGGYGKLNLPNGLGNGEWTIEGWFRVRAFNDTYQMMMSSFDVGAFAIGINGGELVMGVNAPAGGDKTKEWYSPGWQPLTQSKTGAKPELNKWHHFALVFDGSAYMCFFDGKLRRLESSTDIAAPFKVINLGAGWGYWQTNNSYPSNVNLDNIAVTVGKAKYTGNFTPAK